MSSTTAQALYAMAWFSFGLGHSLLANETVKKRLAPGYGAYYRLGYNVFASLHIALVVAAGWYLFDGGAGLEIAPWMRPVLSAVQVVGWVGFLWALKDYDLGLLAGTAQIRNRLRGLSEPEDEPLLTRGMHRYVRHPLYAWAFLILWGRVGSQLDLATAAWGSAYLVIGSFFEERKLLRIYGKAYADYRRQVPAFIPWKGRAIL